MFKGSNPILNEYFGILADEIPEFLYDYIDTKEMQRLHDIGQSCGTDYSKMFNHEFYHTVLDHSIGVALIVWNFTKDKKQTIAGLFHDIATPVFKHAIDFMNGDYETQESTEELTTKIISDSKEIMSLLKRDGINLKEIDDYHIYPIADNDSPRLAADRLEYTLTNGLGGTTKLWNIEDVREIYKNLEIQKNEDGIEELGFKDLKVAEKFVHTMSQLSSMYIDSKTKFSMQFLADIMKKMSSQNLITANELYTLKEKDVIERIEECSYDNISKCFEIWRNSKTINESDEEIEDKYLVSVKAKIRYSIPLVNVNNEYIRIDKISETAKEDIERAKNYKTKKYAYLDFNF